MTYMVETASIQLDAADCLAIKNHLTSTAGGYPVDAPNIQLDKHDLAVLNASVILSTPVAVHTENIDLTAFTVSQMKSHIT